jgi:N-acyl-D-amino-acid deacylase
LRSPDLLFANARIIDGTGSPSYNGHVAVDGDRVFVLRGDLSDVQAGLRIDVAGQVVSPGFIDMHSHTGLIALADTAREAKLRQGVTTELVGVDGNSYAPFADPRELQDFVRFNGGLDGMPDIDYDWDTVATYLDRFESTTSINIAMLVGNSALRIAGVGWGQEAADEKSLANMEAILRESMEHGAFGLSSGLDYPPGSHADTAELGRLANASASLGGIYHTHVRYQLGDRFLDPFQEALTIGRESGSPVHLTHLYRRATAKGGSAPLLELVDTARAEGLDVTFDTYPYEWSQTRLSMLLPLWAQVGRPDEVLDRLRDPAQRERILQDVDARGQTYGGDWVWRYIRVGELRHPDYAGFDGKTIAQISDTLGLSPGEVVVELTVAENFRATEVAAGPHGPSIPNFLTHSAAMVGSDSVYLGRMPSPRSYGTFPRILGEFVREERYLGIEDAIRKMTSYPAGLLGLRDRGLVRDGMYADLVVFDPDEIKSRATYDNPTEFPVGISHVVVNGQLALSDGMLTTARPGRALRRGRT